METTDKQITMPRNTDSSSFRKAEPAGDFIHVDLRDIDSTQTVRQLKLRHLAAITGWSIWQAG
ncbi:hypothetical protein [Burkholderia pseudomallei]|uniref:hypothetical protein n=1 Tax=Burkholderia pseudomallei TaxID=28450 RepID=UPI0011CEC9DF|nr:hypothetical protein [Burkholderia pseudomallei]